MQPEHCPCRADYSRCRYPSGNQSPPNPPEVLSRVSHQTSIPIDSAVALCELQYTVSTFVNSCNLGNITGSETSVRHPPAEVNVLKPDWIESLVKAANGAPYILADHQ